MLACRNSTVPNQAAGAFWAVLNRLLIIFQVIILLLSELSWPAMGRFFDTYFPVLGPSFGLGALGVFECLIGAAILSHHVDDFALVAAFFLFSIGCVNILLGLVFRTRAKELRSIPAFREAGKPVLPTSTGGSVPPFASARSASPVMDEKVQDWDAEKSYYRGAPPRDQWQGYGFGRQGEKAAGLRGFLISKPIESLPRYAPGPRPDSVASSARSSPTRGRSPARSSIRQESRERPVPTFASSGSAI